MQIDLFGAVVPTTSAKPKTERKAQREKIVFDRKALWSSSGYLPGAKLVAEADVAKVTSTTDTRCDNAIVERLEVALGMKPKVVKGEWIRDVLGFQYQRTGKPFTGAMRFGERGSALRDLNSSLVLNSARAGIEPLFTNRHCWLVVNSLKVLEARLRMMDESEDHQACLKVFLEVLAQHDFIDNTRSGETIRSLTKRDQMRELRAKARADKGLPPTPEKPKHVIAVADVADQDDVVEKTDPDEAFDVLALTDEENLDSGGIGFVEAEEEDDEDELYFASKGGSRISNQLMSDMETGSYFDWDA